MASIIIEKSLPYMMAIWRDDQGIIQDVYLDFDDDYAPIGSIFKGKVTDLYEEHGYGFVDIGFDKRAYLSLSKVSKTLTLKRGQELLVQVEKTPHLEKGSVVSALVEYSGNHLILTPYFKGIRLSKEFSEKAHRELKTMLAPHVPKTIGLMVRTSAVEVSEPDLLEELKQLLSRRETCEKQLHFQSDSCVYKEKTGIEKWLASHENQVDEIWLSSSDPFEIKGMSSEMQAKIQKSDPKVKSWFAEYQLDALWSKLTLRHVPLKIGAALVIDETEAFAIIDVNSEGYIHQNKSESFALTVNLASCAEIARQIRLRNLSGALLIDFIDMDTAHQREQVIACLLKELSFDKESVRIVGFTALGILEMTRRRRRPSLLQLVGDLNHRAVTPAYSVYQVNRELMRIKAHITTEKVVIHLAESSFEWMKRYQNRLEETSGISLLYEFDLNLTEGYRLTLK